LRRRRRRRRLRLERGRGERRGEELRSSERLTYHAEVAAEVLVSGEGREEGNAGGRTNCFPSAFLPGAQANLEARTVV